MRASLIVALALCIAVFSLGVMGEDGTGGAGKAADDRRFCGACHLAGGDGSGPLVDADALAQSAHREQSCSDCHGQMQTPHRAPLPKVDCAACHAEDASSFRHGVHWRATAAGVEGAPTCVLCHGDHAVMPAETAATPFGKRSAELICSRCHRSQAEEYRISAHAKAFDDPGRARWAPTCVTCHGEHSIRQPGAPGAPISGTALIATCGSCHDDPAFHEATGAAPNRAASYRDSIHGLRNRFGQTTVATCEDCHGAHAVLPASDPQSKIAPDRLVETCRACHRDANANFVASPVHVQADPDSSIGVFVARWFYILFIGVLVTGFVVHIAFDLFGRRGRRRTGGAA
jgi:hypothetical protein